MARLRFIKFFGPAKGEDDPENFYMEREWRLYGNLNFQVSDVSGVTLPGSYVDQLREDVLSFLGRVDKAEDAIA